MPLGSLDLGEKKLHSHLPKKKKKKAFDSGPALKPNGGKRGPSFPPENPHLPYSGWLRNPCRTQETRNESIPRRTYQTLCFQPWLLRWCDFWILQPSTRKRIACPHFATIHQKIGLSTPAPNSNSRAFVVRFRGAAERRSAGADQPDSKLRPVRSSTQTPSGFPWEEKNPHPFLVG